MNVSAAANLIEIRLWRKTRNQIMFERYATDGISKFHLIVCGLEGFGVANRNFLLPGTIFIDRGFDDQVLGVETFRRLEHNRGVMIVSDRTVHRCVSGSIKRHELAVDAMSQVIFI